jgi:RHS repeat-associated protein
VEEYNYYPYGLVFGASSAAATIKKTDYLYNGKELQHNEFGDGNGLELEDYGARMYDPQIGRWGAVDPLSEKRNSLSPYNYCQDNPILRIDPNGALDGDYVTENGKKIGNDGKTDENIHVVTNKADIKKIKENDKAGSSTDASTVKINYTTTKVELTESMNTLDRTTANGGLREETAVVTPDGVVTRGKSGEETKGPLASATLPSVAGNNNTSIHSHPTGETATGGFDATLPGPKDAAAFLNYKQNIIVGPLGAPTVDAYGNSIPRTNGAVFFDRNSTHLGTLTVPAIKRILKP